MPFLNDAQWNYLTTQSWPVRAAQGLLDAAMAPGNAYLRGTNGQIATNQQLADEAANFAVNVGLLGSAVPRPANSIGMGGKMAQNDLTFYHGGPVNIEVPRATVDPEGLPLGFSVTPNKKLAEWYASGAGRAEQQKGVVSSFSVSPDKFKPIDEFELYNLETELEQKLGLDEGDLPEEILLNAMKERGINAIAYSIPDFGIRIIDPSILQPVNKR